MQNNNLTVVGTLHDVTTYLTFEKPSHTLYKATLSILRLSGKVDDIPCLIDDVRVPIGNIDLSGTYIVDGELRTRREVSDGKRHNRVYIHITAVTPYIKGMVPESLNDTTNKVCITGQLCTKPTLIEKNNGNQVSTVIVRVDGRRNRSYYIPCMLRGDNAVNIAKLQKHDTVTIRGRIQQREYIKPVGDYVIHGVAYEICVQEYKVICE